MKRMIASCLVLSALALTIIVRTVCPRSDGTSLPRAMMRILPSLISCRPNGGAAQPISTWPDITAVSVAAGPPVAVGSRLGAELADEGDDDVVRARAVGRIGDGGVGRGVLQAFDLRIRLHVPEQIAGAGEGRRQNAHRRALGEGAHDAGGTDAGADIGRARDHRLDGFAGALRAGILQHQPMFLEDAGVLAERRRLVFPVVDLADHQLERVFGGCRGAGKRQRHDQPERGGDGLEGLHSISSLASVSIVGRRQCATFNTECGPRGKPNLSAPPQFTRPARLCARPWPLRGRCRRAHRLWPPASPRNPTSG